MCKSNYEKVLIKSGIGTHQRSEFLGESVVVPTKKLVEKAKKWSEDECFEYAKSSVEKAFLKMTPEEKEDYGSTARFVDASHISYFIIDARNQWQDEEQYFVKMEDERIRESLHSLYIVIPSSGKEKILRECRKDRDTYLKFRLASEAIRECETTIGTDNRVKILAELNVPKEVSERASLEAIERRRKYYQNIKKIFRKKGAKQFIIDNVIDASSNQVLGRTGSQIRNLLSNSLSSSDDIMNSGRVVDGSAFSGKKSK